MKEDWWKLLKGMEDAERQMDICPECQQPYDSSGGALSRCDACTQNYLAQSYNAETDAEKASRSPSDAAVISSFAAYPETDNQNWQDSIEAGEPMDNAWSSLLKEQAKLPENLSSTAQGGEFMPQEMGDKLGQGLAAARQQQPKPLQFTNPDTGLPVDQTKLTDFSTPSASVQGS